MSRPDLTDSVIHFIRAPSDAEAYEILSRIAMDKVLLGGSGFVKGGYVCVCFTELPLSLAKLGLVNAAGNTRYTRLGVMVPKDWLFVQGGRPVIYQSIDEFELLPESKRWRHVTFNLGTNPIDFTWEREWRIHCESLPLDPDVVTLIVPTAAMKKQLRDDHENDQYYQVRLYSTIMDEAIAEGYCEAFKWNIQILR
jgi:hypothetical protein